MNAVRGREQPRRSFRRVTGHEGPGDGLAAARELPKPQRRPARKGSQPQRISDDKADMSLLSAHLEPKEPEPAMLGHIDPEREQFDAFKALNRDEPVMMLNLIRLRPQAAYPDGREASGAEAYASYGRESGPIFRRVGGEIIWRGEPRLVLIGPADEHWDIAFIARYPSAHAFMAMVTDPEYRLAVVHRQAAVQDSRLIRMGEASEGDAFA